jgi:hypothetical protein
MSQRFRQSQLDKQFGRALERGWPTCRNEESEREWPNLSAKDADNEELWRKRMRRAGSRALNDESEDRTEVVKETPGSDKGSTPRRGLTGRGLSRQQAASERAAGAAATSKALHRIDQMMEPQKTVRPEQSRAPLSPGRQPNLDNRQEAGQENADPRAGPAGGWNIFSG